MASNDAKRLRTEAAAADDDRQLQNDDVLATIEKLQETQEELTKINEEAVEKIFALEKKYNEAKEPVFVQRNQLISKLPHFWLSSFSNHPKLGELFTSEDQKILGFMVSLHVKNFDDMWSGYCITFDFKTNPYFKNARLSKTVKFSDDGKLMSTGTSIEWKDGMAPTGGTNEMKEGNKRPLPPVNSFFIWFFSLGTGYVLEVAEIIKEELWVNPIEHLTKDEDDDKPERGGSGSGGN